MRYVFLAIFAVGIAAPGCTEAKADEGRDMMRCVAHAFADTMGPYTDAKATPGNTTAGQAIYAAMQACKLEWLLREQPAIARHLSDNAIIYWAMKD